VGDLLVRLEWGLGMVTDITQRKLAEAELHRNREIREMTSKLLTAQEEERRRISGELHKDIVQKVAALAIGMTQTRSTRPLKGNK
jgi:signal transduction histidine kinase